MEILNCLLEISVYAVLLFIIVVAIKKIFNHKMSSALHFLIWFMLIARLCIPFTIDSGIRLIVIPEKTISAFQLSADGQLQREASLGWSDYFFIVWLIGIVLLSIRLFINMTRMNRQIKRQGTQPSPHTQELLNLCRIELGINKNIKLYLLPSVTTPAITIGFLPKLVLPTNIDECLSEEQLVFAIKHELMHYKRRDHLIVLLLHIIKVIYWFNPVVWLMGRHISLDMESACDSMVVRDLDNQQRRSYALLLVQLSSQGTMLESVLGLVLGNNEKIVEKRIHGVFLKYLRKRGVIVAGGVITVILFIGCFTNIFQPVIKTEIADNQVAGSAYITDAPIELMGSDNSADLNDNSQIVSCSIDSSFRNATGTIIKPEMSSYFVTTTTENGLLDQTVTINELGTGEFLTIAVGNAANSMMTTSDMAAIIETSLRDNQKQNFVTP